QFAERNETNSQSQGEAARAYRKVAALCRLVGRDQDAEEFRVRALARFEWLVRLEGPDSEYTYELARTLAFDESPPFASPRERDETDLRRAIAMVEVLFPRAPEARRRTYAAALARWKARLADGLDRLGRAEEAVATYRESIAHDEWLADHVDDPAM